MAKAVFDTKAGSGYGDRIEERYNFPAKRNYLAVAHAAIGDWIVYREPQRNSGRRAYMAAARVTAVEPDPPYGLITPMPVSTSHVAAT